MLDGLFVRAWTRDGLLADLGADPRLAEVLARVPDAVPPRGSWRDAPPRAFPLALSRGVQTTGLYYNKALLDQAGLEPPRTIADLKAMVQPLAALGAAPLVHCSGDVSFNPLLVMWLLPMIAERTGDPLAFVESTIKGDVGYDSPEWIEAFQTIADLRTSGVLLDGVRRHGLRDDAAALPAGQGRHDLQRHVAPARSCRQARPPSRSTCTSRRSRSSTARRRRTRSSPGLASRCRPRPLRAVTACTRSSSTRAGPRSTRPSSRACSPTRRSPASNAAIHDPVAREFLPMFEDAITSLNWLWEPEIDAEIGNQVQALVKGDTDPASVGKAIQAVAEELRSSGRSYYP